MRHPMTWPPSSSTAIQPPKLLHEITAFKQAHPDRFHRKFFLHCGDHPLRHVDGLRSLPFSGLWSNGPTVSSFAVKPERTLSNALGAALATALSEIPDNRQPLPTNGWSLEVGAELQSNEIVSY